MEAVQELRRRAEANGQLASDDRMRVIDQPGAIAIEPANPQYIYVPYYDPMVAYGQWWWPSYPPYYWAPWPGYVAYGPSFWWGAPIGLSVGFFFGGFDWHHHYAYVHRTDNFYTRRYAANGVYPGRWQHNYWRGGSGGYARYNGGYARPNTVTRQQFQPRVQVAPQRQFAPREQQSFAPRFNTQQRSEARQNWQARQASPDWRRGGVEPRAQAQVQRQTAPQHFAPRQAAPQQVAPHQAAPQQFAPRFERREMRAAQSPQRSAGPRADRGGGEHSRGGGHRFN